MNVIGIYIDQTEKGHEIYDMNDDQRYNIGGSRNRLYCCIGLDEPRIDGFVKCIKHIDFILYTYIIRLRFVVQNIS